MDGDAARLRGAAALVLLKVLFRQVDFAPHTVRSGERTSPKPDVVLA
jgi:hypothetical protein